MYILRNGKNQDAKNENVALPGDVVICLDKRKSYVVAGDHSYRRLRGEEHTKAIAEFEHQRVALAQRRVQEQIQTAIVMAKLTRKT